MSDWRSGAGPAVVQRIQFCLAVRPGVLAQPAIDALVVQVLHYPEQVRFSAVATQPAPEAASEEMRLAGMLILRPSPPGVKAESCSRR